MNDLTKLVMMTVAKGDTYETEYDGRMYTHCIHCDSENEEHESDCLMLLARDALGDVWTNYLLIEKEKKENAEKERLRIKKRELQRRTCIKCKTVLATSMAVKQHTDTKRCLRKQKNLGVNA